MTDIALRAHNLHYRARGSFWQRPKEVLRGVSLEVRRGEIFGFLGPNGSGKTTTIKAILGFLRPDRGNVHVLGQPPSHHATRRALGFMPERPYFPEHLSALELVRAHGQLGGLSRRDADTHARQVLERVGLGHELHARLATYSKGMVQRAALAQALVTDPELVILDEPMSGLDPMGRRDVRLCIEELRDQGKTVFFSTHILSDAEALCDRVAIVVQGVVRTTGTLRELLGDTISGVDIWTDDTPQVAPIAEAADAQLRHQGGHAIVHAPNLERANQVIDALRAVSLVVHTVTPLRPSIEDVFVRTAADTSGGPT